jgi:hypothetical protein
MLVTACASFASQLCSELDGDIVDVGVDFVDWGEKLGHAGGKPKG